MPVSTDAARPGRASRRRRCHAGAVKNLIVVLLVVWLVVALLGVVIKGLLWLLAVGVVLFLGTAAYGWLKLRSGTGSTVDRV